MLVWPINHRLVKPLSVPSAVDPSWLQKQKPSSSAMLFSRPDQSLCHFLNLY
jgi:hypothetical protein